MAQMQWLGTIPKENSSTYLAQAIKEGTQAYTQTKLQQEKHKLALKELNLKEGELAQQLQMHGERLSYEKERDAAVQEQRKLQDEREYQTALSTLDATKKKELGNLLLDSLNMMDEKQSKVFLSNPQVVAAFEAAGIPVPTGAFGVRPKEGGLAGIGRGIEAIGTGLGNWLNRGKKSNIKSITPA